MKIVQILHYATSALRGDLAADSAYKLHDAEADQLIADGKAELVSDVEEAAQDESKTSGKRKKK